MNLLQGESYRSFHNSFTLLGLLISDPLLKIWKLMKLNTNLQYLIEFFKICPKMQLWITWCFEFVGTLFNSFYLIELVGPIIFADKRRRIKEGEMLSLFYWLLRVAPPNTHAINLTLIAINTGIFIVCIILKVLSSKR